MQVSAGYDAHKLDPLEQLNYQSATYHMLVSSLMSLADELCSNPPCPARTQLQVLFDVVVVESKQVSRRCVAKTCMHIHLAHPY